ncbi:hypothetical protein TNCT_433221 [Trichonephila clavata]|uniref:Uncharacterized protein n=1 Tax=Trichonephila clavata TaxID=2740835 RepID=A0A8X6KHI5_TRICU|nr:hypothetical protein TNCT_433221 [Trichonephila clavata]
MDPFTKQGNCPRTLIRKSPYTKAGYVLGSQYTDMISGATFSEPSLPQSHSLFNKAVFLICHWTTDDLFRITMQCFKSPGHNGIGFPTVLTLLFTQQYNAFNLCS